MDIFLAQVFLESCACFLTIWFCMIWIMRWQFQEV